MDFDAALAAVTAFADPALTCQVTAQRWSPETLRWQPDTEQHQY